ncbi:hypothetical protein GCM10007338_10450 [Corynebacterium pelargi]|nr:hypothetical protein GCM10007338_10450 [Corynebacterium pelargi]
MAYLLYVVALRLQPLCAALAFTTGSNHRPHHPITCQKCCTVQVFAIVAGNDPAYPFVA